MTVRYKLVARIDCDEDSAGPASHLLQAINNALRNAGIDTKWSSLEVPEDWQDQEEDVRL